MGLFSSLTKIVSDPFGSFSGKSQQEQANAMAMRSWNLANDYNHPIQQMERLKAAGLNPLLVYGSGSVTGNTTSAPSLTGGNYSYGLDKVLTGSNKVMSLIKNQADIANTRAATTASQAAAGASGAQAANLNAQTAINETKSRYEKASLIADIDYKRALARKTKAEASIAQGEAELFGSVGGSKTVKEGSTILKDVGRFVRGVMK